MSSTAYQRFVSGYRKWSVFGVIIALAAAFTVTKQDALGALISGMMHPTEGVGTGIAPSTSFAPASAPKEALNPAVPDTINGELVWPDPWDTIME